MLFAGVVDAIRDVQNLRGLAPATDQVFKLDSPRFRRRLFEAVVSEASPVTTEPMSECRKPPAVNLADSRTIRPV